MIYYRDQIIYYKDQIDRMVKLLKEGQALLYMARKREILLSSELEWRLKELKKIKEQINE